VKKILSITCALIVAAPLLAVAADAGNRTAKNPCVLSSDACGATEQSNSIQETIAKLQHELDKGSSVYSAAELRQLAAKLNEYRAFLIVMDSNA
jgi:hypothetical protein